MNCSMKDVIWRVHDSLKRLVTFQGKWLNASAYVSVISWFVVRATSILLALTNHSLSTCH